MKKTLSKKLTLTRESILRLGQCVGGATKLCNTTDDCTWSCQLTCFCTTGNSNCC